MKSSRKRTNGFISTIRLSLALTRANILTRGAGTFLGVLWYMIDPLFMFAIFMFVKGIVGKGIEHYPTYLFTGLMMFNLFKKTTSESTKAISNNSKLIKSLKLKNEAFVFTAVLSALFAHMFELAIFSGIIIYFGIPFIHITGYLLILLLLILFILGVSFITATIGTYVKDFANAWGLFTKILWFATPIFYSAKIKLPFNLNSFNPMYYFITSARELVIYGRLEFGMVIISAVLAIGTLIIGIAIFGRAKRKFADII